MSRIYRVKVNEDGWSDWQAPHMANYRMVCCDCGLSHTLEFKVLKTRQAGKFISGSEQRGMRVLFRARRNNRSTAAIRRVKQVRR